MRECAGGQFSFENVFITKRKYCACQLYKGNAILNYVKFKRYCTRACTSVV